jgi:hypothetical protein
MRQLREKGFPQKVGVSLVIDFPNSKIKLVGRFSKSCLKFAFGLQANQKHVWFWLPNDSSDMVIEMRLAPFGQRMEPTLGLDRSI